MAKAKKKTAKNKGGRPRKFKSVAEMQKAIDEYFKTTEKTTICGLALGLGFISRQSFLDYSGYSKEFSDTIKRAKTRIEEYYEGHLTEPNAAGSIFALKNFGWADKHEVIQQRTEGEQLEIDEMKSRLGRLEDAGDGIPTD